jgi:hypothetical protein
LSKQVANKSKELAFNCILLSGKLLPEYNALVGFEGKIQGEIGHLLENLKTYKQIDIIKEKRHNFPDIKVISLVTGNWIRIRRSNPQIPLPLARGTGHLRLSNS